MINFAAETAQRLETQKNDRGDEVFTGSKQTPSDKIRFESLLKLAWAYATLTEKPDEKVI